MDTARQFLTTGIKKGLHLLLPFSFLQDIDCHSPSTYQWSPSYCFLNMVIHVTVLRTTFHCHTKTACNFCFWMCLLWSCMSRIVLHCSKHYRHKYQWYNSRTRSWSSVFFIVCKQSLVFHVNVQQCNARMPHHWASHSEASASL